jgi:hypothetical protein
MLCLLSISQYRDWVFLLLPEMRQKLRMQILHDGSPRFWADYHILIYIHCREWMQSLGSHGSSWLLFVMKVRVWHFVRNSHKAVMTAPMSYNLQIVLGEISVQFVDIYIYIYILNAFYSYFYCEKPIIYALMKATHHANIWYLLLALNPISTWNPSRCKVSLSINCVE